MILELEVETSRRVLTVDDSDDTEDAQKQRSSAHLRTFTTRDVSLGAFPRRKKSERRKRRAHAHTQAVLTCFLSRASFVLPSPRWNRPINLRDGLPSSPIGQSVSQSASQSVSQSVGHPASSDRSVDNVHGNVPRECCAGRHCEMTPGISRIVGINVGRATRPQNRRDRRIGSRAAGDRQAEKRVTITK